MNREEETNQDVDNAHSPERLQPLPQWAPKASQSQKGFDLKRVLDPCEARDDFMAVSFASRPMRARRNKREALCNRIVLHMGILDLLPAGGQDSEASRKESESETAKETDLAA